VLRKPPQRTILKTLCVQAAASPQTTKLRVCHAGVGLSIDTRPEGAYFIANRCAGNGDPRCRRYFAEAFRHGPWLPKIWLRTGPIAFHLSAHSMTALSVAIPTYGREQVLIDSIEALLCFLDPTPPGPPAGSCGSIIRRPITSQHEGAPTRTGINRTAALDPP